VQNNVLRLINVAATRSPNGPVMNLPDRHRFAVIDSSVRVHFVEFAE
jgi:hypothetical protein